MGRLKKIKDQRGETILEVLLSLLIVALCVSFFVGSLVKANEGNKEERKQDKFSFQYLTDAEARDCDGNGGTAIDGNGKVITYKDGAVVVSDDIEQKVNVKICSRDGYSYVRIQ